MSSSFFLFALIYLTLLQAIASDPTDGFSSVPLSNSDLVVQKPYDVSQSDRYSFINGVHRLWVYSTDKPHTTTSQTKPRTEIKINGHDYSSGVWQFEGQAYVPQGTSGVCIMQTFGADSQATTMMLRVYGGSLTYYRSPVLVSNIYNRWFRVNVIHNVGARKVQIFIDGDLKLERSDNGGTNHYFKFGVYAQNDESNYMESRWRGIKIFRK